MELKNIIFMVVFVGAFEFLYYSLKKKLSYIKLGHAENRFDNIGERIKNVISIALFQKKIFQDKAAGIGHASIFWGFIIFLFAVLEALIQGFYSPFTLEFLGPVYSVITLIQDVFSLIVLLAIIYALFRRFVLKVPRLQVEKHGMLDAAFVLFMISIVVISMFGQNISLIIQHNYQLAEYEVRPVSMFLAKTLFGGGSENASVYFEIFWWIHILTIFGFMNFLPYSKHFHVYTSVPNVFFKKLGKEQYAIKPLDLEDESIEQFGVADVDDLSWKQLLDGYACTECGRCFAACPAANSGKPLSPRDVIAEVKHRLEEKAPALLAKSEDEKILGNTLVHNYISDEAIWACTTCNACVYECPVTIEHIDTIVDMRRNLVLMESQFPSELNTVFKNLETNFTPWAFNPQDRAAWAEGMDVKTMAEDPNGEVLFWVGCAGSFDARSQKVTKAIATLLKKADVDFRILGSEEKCNGDTARRLGNEYLAQMLMQENIETLNGYGVKKIITGCPHCFNSLKNEYPQFGGNFEVIHHTQYLQELVDSGKIKLKSKEEKNRVTYHDSCYLGRYNGVLDEPRKTISQIEGVELLEMDRNREHGFCCGAGGGRMFLEETEGERINNIRTKEALDTGADTIASACPFCMTMFNDGVKEFDKTEEVEVKDIAEILLENSL